MKKGAVYDGFDKRNSSTSNHTTRGKATELGEHVY
jgi:hypothetical protein